MKIRFKFLMAAMIVLATVVVSFGQQRLFVVGGGKRPAEGMKKFVEWSGGPNAKLLMITWASGVPDESFAALNRDFLPFKPASIEHAATRPLDADKRSKLIGQLRDATGIFFSGGDQNRIMDVLADEELLRLIREKYAKGTPFGGTSAGAAVMSDPMMTGEADLKKLDGSKVGVRKGLGLLPNVIFDQHFLVRQRHNRLLGLMMQNPKMLGIGIDEDTAVLVEDNRKLTVVGETKVLFVHAVKSNKEFALAILGPNESFDVKKRRP